MFAKTFWNHYQSNYVLLGWLFLRGLAIIYFCSFASMAVQIEGLIGSNGILPIAAKLSWIEQLYPAQKFWQMPSIFWLNASDFMLGFVCYAGMAAAFLLLLNLLTRVTLIVCFILYLSIANAGQDFTYFQWDAFLLETGFLAIFLTWGSGITILLFRWLLARFMFMSGVVKIASADPTWANFTALQYHYETQPLPSPVAYYAHHLPLWFHKMCVAGVFFIELVVPFFIFLPRPFRLFACAAFILLQGLIILTGNYTFFNILTLLLCLFLLEDADIARILPKNLSNTIQQSRAIPANVANSFAGLWASLVMLICACHLWTYHVNVPLFDPLKSLLRSTSTLFVVNNYGPFPIMTTQRNEIIVQGSNDGLHWSDYEFKYKPGKLDTDLGWNIPHQPRLDWQMWFAALSRSRNETWFGNFMLRLLQSSPQVLSLLKHNPFPDQAPFYIRAMIYRYRFTDWNQRQHNGTIWDRQHGHVFWPSMSLKNNLGQK